MISYILALLFAALAAGGWIAVLFERRTLNSATRLLEAEREYHTAALTFERTMHREQLATLTASLGKLAEILPAAMSPWIAAKDVPNTAMSRQTAEGRHAYLASPEARETLKKRLKEQNPNLTEHDLDEAIEQVNAQVMGVRIDV